MSRSRIVVGVIMMAVWCLPFSTEAGDAWSIRLHLRYNSQSQLLEVLDQQIVHFAAPKRRRKMPREGEVVLECQNTARQSLLQIPIADPMVQRSEWQVSSVSPSDAGKLAGEESQLEEGEFVVSIPFNEQLAYLTLYTPTFRFDHTVESLQSIGTCPIDRNQLLDFVAQQNVSQLSP